MSNGSTASLKPYHAHVYYDASDRKNALHLHRQLLEAKDDGGASSVLFVGAMRDRSEGPHPKPQFEVHFYEPALDKVLPMIRGSGLTALVHPLTDDDLADHTSLAMWIGEPLPLDHSVLDPPGRNQGIARFGRADF